MTPTGRYRVRRGLFGAPILQAEYRYPSGKLEWIDAVFSQVSHVVFQQIPLQPQGVSL